MGQDQEERRAAAEVSPDDGARPVDGGAVEPTEPGGTVAGPGAPSAGPHREVRPAGRGARVVREVVETIVLALVIFAAVRLVVANYRVDGDSMVPNLDDGQMLLVNVNAYQIDLNRILNWLPGVDQEDARILYSFGSPERGDIVVFDPPVESDQPFIKRVIGLPGEEVAIRGGAVNINGEPLAEPYLADPDTGRRIRTRCGRQSTCQVTVAEGHVFVLGDNRQGSEDSRSFGPIEVEDIAGKAWFSYWPVDEFGLVPHEDYPDVPEGPVPTTEAVGPDRASPVASPEAEADA